MQISSSPSFTPPPAPLPFCHLLPFMSTPPHSYLLLSKQLNHQKSYFLFNYRTLFYCFFPPPKKYNRIGLVILFILI